MKNILRAIGALTAAQVLCFSSFALADHHLFEFEYLYTNASGTIQFIVMHQTPPTNGEDKWGGTALGVLVPGKSSNSNKFPTDLPSSITMDKRVLIASQSFAALGLVTPDYVFPDGFLPVTGARLSFADFHYDYDALPIDGVSALDAFLLISVPAIATNFSGQSAPIKLAGTPPPPTATKVRVVEYYNQSLDHYFITHVAAEIAALDSGVTIKGWVRTGESFNVYIDAQPGSSPVCRYYMPPEFGNSHFFGRGKAECDATGQKNPGFVLEDANFMQVFLPTAGACAAGLVPIYRVFSNRADANHRYMTSAALRTLMVARGWVAEGDGPDLVVMCAVP